MSDREQTPIIENPWKVGQRVFWNYPHDDMEASWATVLSMPEYPRHYSYVRMRTDAGEEGLAIYSELSENPLK